MGNKPRNEKFLAGWRVNKIWAFCPECEAGVKLTMAGNAKEADVQCVNCLTHFTVKVDISVWES